MKAFQIIEFLIKDELEAIDGYVRAIGDLKANGVSDEDIQELEKIKKDEYDHIAILQKISAKNKFDEINIQRIGE